MTQPTKTVMEDLHEFSALLASLQDRRRVGEVSTLLLPTLDAIDALTCLAEEAPEKMQAEANDLADRFVSLLQTIRN